MREIMKPEYLISLPKRGIQIIPPAETAINMARARNMPKGGGEKPRIQWSEQEKTRLWLMKKERVMSKRYPSKETGKSFMDEIDYQARDFLFVKAVELSDEIATKWNEIDPDNSIAVILFGSVARGLVKNSSHPDPSNIDLVVMGNLSEEQKLRLFDEIRPTRTEISETGYSAGVIIQPIERVTKNDYSDAITRIAAGAVPLHDPAGIWANIEKEALDYATIRRLGNLPIPILEPASNPLELQLDEEDPRSNAAFSLFAETGIPLDTGLHAPIAQVDMQVGKAYFPRRIENS